MSDLGNPRLEGALAVIECAKESVLPGGDHSIIVGRALSARVGSGEPTVYFQRRFHRIAPSQ
jgi:flavin reductase (DIM6/NTAB) family NADH-FMN oxidoreductase RutF